MLNCRMYCLSFRCIGRQAGPDGLPLRTLSLSWCGIGLLSLQPGAQLECVFCTNVALYTSLTTTRPRWQTSLRAGRRTFCALVDVGESLRCSLDGHCRSQTRSRVQDTWLFVARHRGSFERHSRTGSCQWLHLFALVLGAVSLSFFFQILSA